MDKNTERELQNIGRTIPKRLLNNLTRERPDERVEEAREKLEWAAKKGKDYARSALNSGAFKPSTVSAVDEKTTRQLNEHVQGRVDYLIKSGKIPPAKQDDFMAKMQDKFRR
jgi:hypothetical protein